MGRFLYSNLHQGIVKLNFGPSGMRAEHLRMWHRAEKWEENPDSGNWEKVVSIIQGEFKGRELTAPCAWKMVLIIHKGGGTNFRDISLV